jgi:hypothetical protein
MVTTRARLQRGEQRRPGERIIVQFLFQQGEFGVLPRFNFSSECFTEDEAVTRNNCADFWRDSCRLAYATPSEGNRPKHQFSVR